MSTYIETLTRGSDYIAPRTKLEAVDGAENLYTKTEVNTLLASKVDGNNAITGATKCKVTYDSKGLITSGSDLAAADIPALDASKIISGVFTDARIASAATWNGKLTANTMITGATKCKVTYDSKGLVTSGSDLSASDVPNLDTSKITSGAFADERISSAATWNAKANTPVIVSISLLAASWSGSASPYSQTISVAGSTANSKIDLQPDATVLGQMIDDGCMAICVVNNNNVLTAYAVGDKPTVNLTVQATMYEVVV